MISYHTDLQNGSSPFAYKTHTLFICTILVEVALSILIPIKKFLIQI